MGHSSGDHWAPQLRIFAGSDLSLGLEDGEECAEGAAAMA
jgi:hypothetical protein